MVCSPLYVIHHRRNMVLGVLSMSLVLATPVDVRAVTTLVVPITIQVVATSTLACAMHEFIGGIDQGPVSSMSFGTLQRATNPDGSPGPMTSPSSFMVICSANNGGIQYQVSQNGGSLVSGVDRLPDSSWIVTPSNGTLPPGAVGGSQGTAAAINKLLYRSSPAGEARSVSATYTLTTVPANQPAGSYTTTVTITLANMS